MDQIKIGDIVGIVYKLEKRLKSESSWVIYQGVHLETGERVAVKMESVKMKHPSVPQEADMYMILQGGTGIPNFKWSGVKRGYNALVTGLLGLSLEELFNYCNRRFSLKTIQRVEYMHSKGVLHRDISPDNFLLKRDYNQVYIINYGKSKRYRELETHRHIPRRGDQNPLCTAQYATLNNIRGEEPSRRDDLESLGYVLMYFLRGSLPWQIPNHGTAKEQYEKMCQKKFLTSIEALCEPYSSAFLRFFLHCKSLKFEDAPNYSYLKSLFQNLYAAKGYTVDHMFDWNKRPSSHIRESTSRTQQVTRRLPQLSLEETSSEKGAGNCSKPRCPR